MFILFTMKNTTGANTTEQFMSVNMRVIIVM